MINKGLRDKPKSRVCDYCETEYTYTRLNKYCSNSCKNKAFHFRHKSKRNLKSREYSRQNKETLRETRKEWYLKNRKTIRIKRKQDYSDNRLLRVFDAARSRAKKLNAVPKWVDIKELVSIYEIALKRNLAVDHIVPLKSDLVCGLHCEANLRCIPKELNQYKGNRYWSNMP